MHTMHISHHLLQCKLTPTQTKIELKQHRHTSRWLNNKSKAKFMLYKRAIGWSIQEILFPISQLHWGTNGVTSQRLYKKLGPIYVQKQTNS